MISRAYRWVVSNAGLTKHKKGTVIPRRRPLWCVPGLAAVVLAGVVTVAHGQSSPVLTAPTALDKENGSGDRVIPGDGLWAEPPVSLSTDVPVHRVTVIRGPGGGTVVNGQVSSSGTICVEDPSAVYCNTLGPDVFGPSDALASARIADDITLAGVGGCILDRYVIRVTGDRKGDGSGTALGAYTVDFGLYQACPGAGGNPIQDTAGQITVPAEEAGIIKEIVFHPPGQVALPSSLYLGVRFSRDLCGTVVGALATLGHSADRFDFPGFPCAAWFGGFPDGPHASFYAEIYVEGDCPDAFVGYKNTNHAGIPYSAGVQGRFADDIELGVVDCNMVAYEVAHKGDGIIGVDLRSFLSNTDPDHGGVIPGTELYCLSSGNDVQVCRKELETPIPLPPASFFVTYRTSSAYAGPLRTCKRANPGDTANFFMVYTVGEWRPQEFDAGCWGGFELTIFCEGTPPTGACCDMILTDQDGEAVCRDNLPLMNCANPVPFLWQEDQECASTCIGGGNAGEPCTRQADCPEGICPGPFDHPCGVSACCKPDGGCQNLTQNACYALEPVDAPRMYQREQFCDESGQQCPIVACLGREGECTLPREAYCVAGERHGLECYPYAIPSDCPGQTCLGGPRDGETCDPDNQCPDDGADIGRCVDFVCDGGSNDGNPCNPNVECLPGGECTQGRCVGGVGCENPFCCTSVCQQPGFAYCCTEWWDDLCAAETFRVCDLPPSNDDCYRSDPREGARLVSIPSYAESDGLHATAEAEEPGFCCNSGHESDPSLGPGSRGFGTVWYKFVAPPNGQCDGGDRAGQYCDPNAADPENPMDGCPGGTCLWLPVSVGMDTCCSVARGGTVQDPGGLVRDTLLQVFALSEPDRGLCGDGLTVCSVSEQDCPDGSSCEFDEEYACATLLPIACSDDEETCACMGVPQPIRSKACARDLVPGETYYVMVGAKTNRLNQHLDAYIDRGVYKLRVWTPCGGTRLMDNDLCMNAEVLTGEQVVVPFDISGEAFNRAPATFDCPGPPVTCFDVVDTMQNDVWYEWTAPYDGEATFQTCGFDENGDPSDDLTPETAMVVYDGCDCPVQVGTELGCSYFEPSPCFLGSKVTTDVVEGRCYKVRLGGRLGRTHDDQGDPVAGDLRIEVTVPECAPSIIHQPADQTVCVGDMATFTVLADGWEPLTYQWRKDAVDLEDGGNVTGATTAVLTIDPAGLDDAGQYDVVVSNVCGTVTSNAATLALNCVPGGGTFSVVAVRINATCVGGANTGEHCTRDVDCDSGVCGGGIAPTNTVLVKPGDKIQCEVLASGWSPEGQQLTAFQFEFDSARFQAVPPAQGELIPYRGPRPCQNDLECSDCSAICMNGFCDTLDDRAGGLFIRVGRLGYVFFNLGQFEGTDFFSCRFGATIFNRNDGPVYAPPPKYCGTLILTVSEDAYGVFTVAANTDSDYATLMLDFDRLLMLPLEIEPLTITVQQPPKPAPRQPPSER